MDSPITMGEAGDNVCKEKAKHTDDGVCVNGDLSCDDDDDLMEICENDSKAPEVNSSKIDSLKHKEKVPENKVPKEAVNNEPIEIDLQSDEESSEEQIPSHKDSNNKDKKSEIKKSESKGSASKGKNTINGENSDNSVNGTVKDIDNSKSEKEPNTDDCVELNDSGDIVLIENDSEHKENGEVCSIIDDDDDDVINISDKDTSKENDEVINVMSPPRKKQKKSLERLSDIVPRRSSRNLNKQKSYIEKEFEPEPEEETPPAEPDGDADTDIEEVTPEDPLADPIREEKPAPKKSKHSSSSSSSTIVVSDTKRLVEIAANSKQANATGKKEPTLVIIDTNSILSGRGPVPVSSVSTHKSSSVPASFSMLPVALPAQGVYPPNMRATITPIPMSSSTQSTKASSGSVAASISAVSPMTISSISVPTASVTPTVTPPTPILPTLTDDMYVVEAPSFIVPYVYEKPPLKPLKDFVTKIKKDIEEMEKLEAEEERLRMEEEKLKKEEEKLKKDKEKMDEEKSDNEPKKNDKDNDSDNEGTDKDTKNNDEAENEKKNKKESKTNDNSKNTENKEDSNLKESEESSDKNKTDLIVITPKDDNLKTIDLDEVSDEKTDSPKPKSNSYFDNALGHFFINIGFGLVQEYVQTDLLKQQKRKQKSEGTAPETKMAINSLIKNLEYSKENNEPYKMEQKRCEFCSFKSESSLVLAHHLETPHMRNYVYKCNFCPVEFRSPHDILFHMEAEHNSRGRLERAPAFHQCPNCPFEDNQKGKLSRHSVTCLKKFKPENNLAPPLDWEPPAKIPRIPRIKQQGLQATAATYQALAQAKGNYQLFSKLQQAASPQAFSRGRGRPSLMGKVSPIRPQTPLIRTSMMYRPGSTGGSVLVPTTYQFGGNQIFQNSSGTKSTSGKVVQQPSISITPLPRQPSGSSTTITKTGVSSSSATVSVTSGDSNASKATFVICEICDGYIKDLEQLRNHMQWIHKVKIHPKMIYNRPPLNCQKCQFRFFTDQGLERHLLGSHGLVTSSMQEAANKSKDAGRCPVCGRVYQWKLLNHVARDHNMTLKPAHLSYKCTVCTATFGMYKQFENHVYSAHSVVAKRVMDKKSSPSTTTSPTSATTSAATISSRGSNDSLLKPLKINDEITIIPQPAKSSKNASTRSSNSSNERGK